MFVGCFGFVVTCVEGPETTCLRIPCYVLSMDRSKVSMGLGICGGLIAIGCFLPWVTALGGLLSVSGMDSGDGKIVFTLGLLILVTGIYVHPNLGPKKHRYVIALLCSVLSLLISLIDIIDVGSLAADTPLASIGTGLYLCVIASFGSLIFSLIGAFKLTTKDENKSVAYETWELPPPPPWGVDDSQLMRKPPPPPAED